jgi:hypothetical protein
MKKKFINTEKIIGRVYSHKLELKTVKNEASANYGKSFITGTVEIAVDEEGLNVIPVHFTYETGESKRETYDALKMILDTNKVWTSVGKDEAIKVRIDTTLSVNDFIARDGKPVCTKVNEGGFVQLVSMLPEEEQRNTFSVDMLINRVTRVEADPEKNISEEYAVIYGGVFSFKNEYLPVDFIVKDPIGINHFEGFEPSNSNPVITKLWGSIECLTKKVVTEEESAFGKAAVSSYEKKSKEWVVTGTAPQPYDFGDESILTEDELRTMLQNRELVLAEVKKRKEERDNAASAPAATPVVNKEFKF